MSLLGSLLGEEATELNSMEVFIAIRTDDALGSGSAEDPYNGSTDILLDKLLSNQNGERTLITEDMTIRFGPGVFQTKGVGAQNFGLESFLDKE